MLSINLIIHYLRYRIKIPICYECKCIYMYEYYVNVYNCLGSMAQWDNQKLVSQRVRLQAVLEFLLCL